MHSLEAIHCYFITNNFIGNKVKQAFKAVKYKNVPLIFTHAGISVISLYFTRSELLDALPFRWVAITMFGIAATIQTITLFMIMTSVVKSNEPSMTIDEITLMFFIFFLINLSITSVTIIPALARDLLPFNQILQIVVLCASLIIFTILLLWILNKIDLNKLFIFVIHRLALKLVVFAISLIALLAIIFTLIFYVRFDAFDVLQAIIPLGVIVILLIIGFIHTLKAAHQYEVVVPEKYHDMKRILTLLNLRAEDAQTVDELREMIDATIELMGIKVAKPEPQESVDEPKDFEAFIRCAIDSLKLNHQSDVEINANIQHFEPHKNVSAMNVSYMLGTLLENAIESGTKNPILVDILSTEHVLFIKVANEIESKTPQELYNMLSKGYSTKEKVGRGFGLSKLKSLVESHKGNIIITQEMNPIAQANYIVFTLNF